MKVVLRLILVSAVVAVGCAHTYLPGTQILDQPDTRAVFDLVLKIREAFEQKSVDTLLAMISTTYFEDNGTPDPHDDYGYTELKEKLLTESMALAKEVYLSFEVHDVMVDGDRAYADVRYATRTRLDFPSGRLWDTHRDFNRINFAREAGVWKVIGGL